MIDTKVWRILDASINRANEGLRTIEEYTRFVLNDGAMTECLKQLRHDVASAAEAFPANKRLSSRDTPGDVGTRISNDSEQHRPSAVSVAAAACARVQQSLRCLEEYGKLVDTQAAARFESVRYRTYQVFAAIEQLPQRCERLNACRLYVLVDGCANVHTMTRLMLTLAAAGVDMIQLRDKRLDDRSLFERARAASNALRPTECQFIVNDRPDIAMAVGACGVHVGQDELPASAARQLIGPEMILGVSTHDIQQARQAVLDGADYIGCGPTFPSQTKSFESFAGLDFLQQVVAEISLPAMAIGGIDADNIHKVKHSGFKRVALSSAIVGQDDPAAAAAAIKAML